MKKFITLIAIFIALTALVLVGCKKPMGTFAIDNYVEYTMYVDWNSYDMSCPALGYNSYEVKAGSATAYVTYAYGDWGSIYFSVPEDGTETLYIYWDGKKSSTPEKNVSNINPELKK